ncbi:MAG: hypothetical protein ACTSQL_10925 [Promethearchaeota archaeon]
MTKIYLEENKIEDVKIILSSTSLNIKQATKNDDDQHEIKKPRRNIEEIIKIKSTEDPFKFIAQEKQKKDNANSNVKLRIEDELKPEFKMYRQGDILFKKIATLPARLKLKLDNVVAGGEGAAHAHMLVDGELFQSENSDTKLYIKTHENSRLLHEEHLPIKLESGIYEVIRQREYLGPGLMKKEAIVRYVVD